MAVNDPRSKNGSLTTSLGNNPVPPLILLSRKDHRSLRDRELELVPLKHIAKREQGRRESGVVEKALDLGLRGAGLPLCSHL